MYDKVAILNVEDAVNTVITPQVADELDQIFRFPHTFFKQQPYGGKKQIKTHKLVIYRGKGGYRAMPTGLVTIAEEFLKSQKYVVYIDGYHERITPKKPNLPGITFRPDQMDAIKSIMLAEWQRGIIVAPTGTGKTIIALGMVSTIYPKHNILILAHTVDLLNQFYDDLIKFGFDEKHISYLKGNDYEFNKITLSTDKKLAKINPKEYADKFDMVIVDEYHHCSGFNTQYAQILSSMLAPIRVGFTATIPPSEEAQWTMKSFAGPVKYELTIQKASKLNLLTVPDIKFVVYKPVEKDYEIKRYSDIYKKFIIENYNRNAAILNLVHYHVTLKQPVLVCIRDLEHLDKLLQLSKNRGIPIYGAQGSTATQIRKEIIAKMREKEYLACIASKVFNEGINIPQLEVVINAAGGKSKIENIQRPGRGTRLAEGKKGLIVYDFVDPYRYLAEHSTERMMLFSNQGWKIEVIGNTQIQTMLKDVKPF